MESELPEQKKVKPPKTPEELADIAYLERLHESDISKMVKLPPLMLVKVTRVKPIPKSGDRYDMVTVSAGLFKSWEVAVERGSAKPGELFVSFAFASTLPYDRFANRLQKYGFKKKSFQVAYKKLDVRILPRVKRTVFTLNPCVLIPLSEFPEFEDEAVGTDLSKAAGAKTEAEMRKMVEGFTETEEYKEAKRAKNRDDRRKQAAKKEREFSAARENLDALCHAPDFVSQTKIPELKDRQQEFAESADRTFEITEKVTGENMTVFYNEDYDPDHPVHVCVNGMDLRYDPKSFWWKVAQKSGIVDALPSLGHDYVFEGVVVGPYVRGGRFEYHNEDEFLVFDIFDAGMNRILPPDERRKLCEDYEIPHVPVVATGFRFFREFRNATIAAKAADGNSAKGRARQGIVCRSDDGRFPEVWVQVTSPKYIEYLKKDRRAGVQR